MKPIDFVRNLCLLKNGLWFSVYPIPSEAMTVVMSITGSIDLKQIGKLTQELKVPGSEQLKNINKQN